MQVQGHYGSFCLGTDCKVDANGKLAGSWYFQPECAEWMRLPRKVGTARPTYRKPRTLQFGHWLATREAKTPGIVVHTYALTRMIGRLITLTACWAW